ncbi:MAG: hypothetical protein ACUVR1_08240, partial [Fimbriimonadales bacterium]
MSVVLLTLREEDPLDESAQAALARMAQEGGLESIRRWANDHRFGVCEMGSRVSIRSFARHSRTVWSVAR